MKVTQTQRFTRQLLVLVTIKNGISRKKAIFFRSLPSKLAKKLRNCNEKKMNCDFYFDNFSPKQNLSRSHFIIFNFNETKTSRLSTKIKGEEEKLLTD